MDYSAPLRQTQRHAWVEQPEHIDSPWFSVTWFRKMSWQKCMQKDPHRCSPDGCPGSLQTRAKRKLQCFWSGTNEMTNPEFFSCFQLLRFVSCSLMHKSFNDSVDENVMETSETPHFSWEENEEQTIWGLLLTKNPDLQHLNDELFFTVFLVFQLCVLCMFKANQKSAPV